VHVVQQTSHLCLPDGVSLGVSGLAEGQTLSARLTHAGAWHVDAVDSAARHAVVTRTD